MQIIGRLIGAREPHAAELPGESLALAGGGQDSDLEPLSAHALRRSRSHSAVAGGDDRNLVRRHLDFPRVARGTSVVILRAGETGGREIT
jgi:hypothetical protein